MAKKRLEDIAIDCSRYYKRQNRLAKKSISGNSRNLEVAVNLYNYVEDTPEMSRAILAEKLDVSQAYLCKVINGNANLTLKTIEKYEELLQVPLLARGETKEPTKQKPLLKVPQSKIISSEVYSIKLESVYSFKPNTPDYGNPIQICLY